MAKDFTYTGGVVAVKETYLLKDKILKLCEASAEDAFRALQESGFGKGAEVNSVHDYERLLTADERDLDEFVREYAATNAEKAYLLSPRDFHNAKALVKVEYLKADDTSAMLAPDGLYTSAYLADCIKNGGYKETEGELFKAIETAVELFTGDNEGKEVSGAEVGMIFDKALYSSLAKACAHNSFLKKAVAAKADMTNILTALRSQTPEYAALSYVSGGKLKDKQLENLFSEDKEKAVQAFNNTDYKDFVKKCIEQKSAGLPLTEAEKLADSLECGLLSVRKYELKKSQPFLYYVFRRRAENINVRILFVCLLSGMPEQEIKRRLRLV